MNHTLQMYTNVLRVLFLSKVQKVEKVVKLLLQRQAKNFSRAKNEINYIVNSYWISHD